MKPARSSSATSSLTFWGHKLANEKGVDSVDRSPEGVSASCRAHRPKIRTNAIPMEIADNTAEATQSKSARRSFASAIEAACSRDRKSTRLNSSHSSISYAVFCLKKKKQKSQTYTMRENP